MRFLPLLLIAFAAPAAAGGNCPISLVSCNQFNLETPGPTYSLACPGNSSVAYDIPGATIDVAAPAPPSPASRGARVVLRDQFTVNGLPAGTPINLHLRVYATGNAFAGGGFGDTAGLILRGEAYPVVVGESYPQKSWGTFDGSIAFDDSLDLVLPRTAGVPIGLAIDANLGAVNGFANAHLSFRFVDLPPGVTATSCNGYLQEQPTPALARSWGGLKAAYR